MTFEQIIERFAELAQQEIQDMADAAYLEVGFSQAWINRSRGQRRRYQRKGKK